jgi:hypothetical protein
VKQLKESVNVITTISLPNSLDNMTTLINDITPTLETANKYMNYFADSDNVTDAEIIKNAELSQNDAKNIQKAIDSINSVNDVVTLNIKKQCDQMLKVIDNLVVNNNLIQKSLNALTTKLSNFL